MWKDVPGYEGIYQASPNGEIRTVEGKVTHSTLHGKRVWKSRVLKRKVAKDNTCRVTLYKNKVAKDWLVHRIIALTFLDNPNNYMYINHIDGDRLNNTLQNLEWCDHHYNNNHAFDTGLISTGTRIVLVHQETKEPKYFRSLTKASEYLGKHHGYLSTVLKKGETEVANHDIYIDIKKVTK